MQPINIATDIINLSTYRKAERIATGPDPVIILVAYAQDELIYDKNRITTTDAASYAAYKNSADPEHRNLLVNKFGLAYARHMPLLIHRRLADVLIDTALDMRDRYQQFTVVMDGLRTYEAAARMQANRPDLVASGMLAPPGASAHNRGLAVDSKLFELIDKSSYETTPTDIPLHTLQEADEHGHLDDEQDMSINSRFYTGPMSDEARANRLQRLVCWQRASVKNQTPIANLLAEFWDDRVPGSPADLWRILTCRALCLGMDGNPTTTPIIHELKTRLAPLASSAHAAEAYALFAKAWEALFPYTAQTRLEALLGPHGGKPPALEDFLFHEWLENIHDHHVENMLAHKNN